MGSRMVLPGSDCLTQVSKDKVADKAVKRLWRRVPAAWPGIVFLSGGHSTRLSSIEYHASSVQIYPNVGQHPIVFQIVSV